MKSISLAVVGSLLALGTSLAPAARGATSFVPLPGINGVGRVSYSPQVRIVNPEGERRVVESLQQTLRGDGTLREEPRSRRLAVSAGKALVLRPEAEAAGMLELRGAEGLETSAYLVASNGDRVGLPVIDSETRGRAEETLTVSGLEGSASRTTGLVILNLGTGVARCTASIVRAEGTYAIEPVEIELLPRSHRAFSDVFRGFPEGIAEAHAEVTCSNDFYVYAQVADAETGALEIVGPAKAGELLSSSFDLLAKSSTSCGVGKRLCEIPGLVHEASKGDTTLAISMVPPVGSYKALRAHVEVQITGWNKANPRGAHSALYLVINRNKELVGSIFLRGPGAQNVTLRHGINVPANKKTKVSKPLPVELGETYTFDYLYDAGSRRTDLRVTYNGRLVAQINDKTNVSRLSIDRGDKLIFGLSNPLANSPEEPASLGWKYSNLRVELIP